MSGIFTDSVNGPASYSTGGITVNTGLTTLESFDVEIDTPHANLGQVHFDITMSGGTATVKVMRIVHDRLTDVGDMTLLPTGITARATSGGEYDTSSHDHSGAHDHAVTPASTTPAGQNALVIASAASPNVTTHTHTLNLSNHVGQTSTETAHTHTWSSIYQHQHSITNTATDLTLEELSNGADLSSATLIYHGIGAE